MKETVIGGVSLKRKIMWEPDITTRFVCQVPLQSCLNRIKFAFATVEFKIMTVCDDLIFIVLIISSQNRESFESHNHTLIKPTRITKVCKSKNKGK